MRPALPLSLSVIVASAAWAQDARVTFLEKQLKSAKDPRVKAQTVLLLGQTGVDSAVGPLCETLKDSESVVRAAAANALGDLRLPGAVECLKQALGEADQTVRGALERAISQGVVAPGALYVSVDPIEDKVGGLSEGALKLADKIIRDKLGDLGATFAPVNEDKKAAQALIKAHNLKGFQLKLQLLPGAAANGLKIEMLILSYPDQALKGSWNVKASGAKPESLIKAMVPRVVDDAAGDLEWKKH